MVFHLVGVKQALLDIDVVSQLTAITLKNSTRRYRVKVDALLSSSAAGCGSP